MVGIETAIGLNPLQAFLVFVQICGLLRVDDAGRVLRTGQKRRGREGHYPDES
jgi:hypothetical protein